MHIYQCNHDIILLETFPYFPNLEILRVIFIKYFSTLIKKSLSYKIINHVINIVYCLKFVFILRTQKDNDLPTTSICNQLNCLIILNSKQNYWHAYVKRNWLPLKNSSKNNKQINKIEIRYLHPCSSNSANHCLVCSNPLWLAENLKHTALRRPHYS